MKENDGGMWGVAEDKPGLKRPKSILKTRATSGDQRSQSLCELEFRRSICYQDVESSSSPEREDTWVALQPKWCPCYPRKAFWKQSATWVRVLLSPERSESSELLGGTTVQPPNSSPPKRTVGRKGILKRNGKYSTHSAVGVHGEARQTQLARGAKADPQHLVRGDGSFQHGVGLAARLSETQHPGLAVGRRLAADGWVQGPSDRGAPSQWKGRPQPSRFPWRQWELLLAGWSGWCYPGVPESPGNQQPARLDLDKKAGDTGRVNDSQLVLLITVLLAKCLQVEKWDISNLHSPTRVDEHFSWYSRFSLNSQGRTTEAFKAAVLRDAAHNVSWDCVI